MKALTSENLINVTGSGLFYDLGAFIAEVANVSDDIYETYGNTNKNHW